VRAEALYRNTIQVLDAEGSISPRVRDTQ